MDRITLEMKTVEEAVEAALRMLDASRDEVDVIVEDEPSKGFLGIGSKNAKVTVVRKYSGLKEEVLEEIEEEKSGFERTMDKVKSETKEFFKDVKEEYDEFKEEYDEFKDDFNEKFKRKNNYLLEETKHYDDEDEMAEAARIYLEKMINLAGFKGHVEIIDEREKEDNIVLDIVLDDYEQNSRIIGKKGDTINSIGYLVSQFVRGRYEGRMIIEVDCGDYIYDQKEKLKAFARNAADIAIRDGSYRLRPMNAYDRRIVHKALNDMEGVSTHSEGEEPRRSIVITRDPQ